MTPPELLHTSGSGIILYIFSVLESSLPKSDLCTLDELHKDLMASFFRQSERDFPRGASRNGLVDGTKCQSTERRGNLLLLLCIAHTSAGQRALQKYFVQVGITHGQFCDCIKLYLAMEEWMHDCNEKRKVRNAHNLIGQVLRKVQKVFRRNEGHRWNIPKMHGMMKMVEFIKLFGSGINFYGGPAESHHKYFVKSPGDLTQRRVSEFAKQVANRVYETMAFEVAHEVTHRGFRLENELCHVNREENSVGTRGDDDFSCVGAYRVTIFPLMNDGSPDHDPPNWDDRNSLKSNQPEYDLHPRLLKMLSREVSRRRLPSKRVRGYTEARAKFGDQSHIFRASPWYRGKPWYDWALISYQTQGRGGNTGTRTYPSRLYGFFSFEHDDADIKVAVCTSTRPLAWEKNQDRFCVSFRTRNQREHSLRFCATHFHCATTVLF